MDGNTEAPAKLPTLLEQIKDAKSIAEFDKVEAGLAEMESKYAGVVYNDISTKGGLARAKADRAAVREVRYSVAALATDMKDPLNRLKKLIDGGADRIKTRVLKIEEPIDAQIKGEEARIEAEKERKRQEAESLRKCRQDKIDAMRNAPTAMAGRKAADIAVALAEIEGRVIELDEFGDQAGAASSAQVAAVAALTAMHAAAITQEAQAEELAKLRADAEARRKTEEAEAAGRAAKEAAERRDREVADQKAREEAAAKQAEADRIAREEAATKLAEREKELAELRAKLEAMQAAQKPVDPPAAAPVVEAAAESDVVDAEFTPPPRVEEKPLEDGTDADPGDEAAPPCPPREFLLTVVAEACHTSAKVAEGWLVSTFGGAK